MAWGGTTRPLRPWRIPSTTWPTSWASSITPTRASWAPWRPVLVEDARWRRYARSDAYRLAQQ
eukprot:scaffold56744_cov66-Phaeocystis_antarctica.AAC.5